MNFAQGRHSHWVGRATMFGCPAVLVAYLILSHSVPWIVAIKAVAALYFLCFVPGYLVQTRLFRAATLSRFETMLSSCLLGMFVGPVMWYAFCGLGISAIYFPITLLAGLAVPLAGAWVRRCRGGEHIEPLLIAADAPILWLSLAIAILWSYWVTMIEIRDGRINVRPYVDHIFHATLIAELSRGVPARAVPFVAGAEKFAYHEMPDVWCAMIRRFTGASLESAYFHFALAFRYLFVSIGCYLALVRRFGRLAALAGVVFLLAVSWHITAPGVGSLFSDWTLEYLNGSYPTAFGLTGVFLILFYVSAIDARSHRPYLLLASVLSVLLLWFKANYALAVAPAVAVVSLCVSLKRQDHRWWWFCVCVQAVIVGIRQWQLSAADFAQVLTLHPLAFLVWWWDTLSVSPGWPATALSFIHQFVEVLPAVLQWPVVMAVCLVHQFHVGLVAVPYLLMLIWRRRIGIGVDASNVLSSLILLCTLVGFALFPVAEGMIWNVSFHLWAMVAALLLPLLGVQLCGVVRRALHRSRPLAATTIAGLLMAGICNIYRLRTMVWQENGRRTEIVSADLHACYDYIQAATPPDSLILHPLHSGTAVGMLTERRVVLEYQQSWIVNFFNTRSIRSDVKRFYLDPFRSDALAILDHYGVDYAIVDVSSNWEFLERPWLVRVFQRGGEAVFRVNLQAELPRETDTTHSPTVLVESDVP